LKLLGTPVEFDKAIEVLENDGWTSAEINVRNNQKYVWLKKHIAKPPRYMAAPPHLLIPSIYNNRLHNEILLVEDENQIQWFVYREVLISRQYYVTIGFETAKAPWEHTQYIVHHSFKKF